MRKIILFMTALSIVQLGISQERPGGWTGNDRPAIGTISGKVLDDLSKEPIEFATVSLHNRRDSAIVDGAITDDNGYFLIEKIKMGGYFMKVSFIGFETLVIDTIRIRPQQANIFLDKIYISPTAQSLEGVTVEAERPFMITEMDKKIFSVDQMINRDGASANELLENIPSIDLDIEGNISMRGSTNVTVLIDGKPSGLTGVSRTALLDQIPASSIETIEIISNPSAKYDPDSMSGIINIKLKKEKYKGFNGTVSAGIGTRDKYDGSLGLNYRTSDFNLFGNYSYRNDSRMRLGDTFRENLLADSAFNLSTLRDGINQRISNMIRSGIDIYTNDFNTLSFATSFRLGERINDNINRYEEFYYLNDSTSQSKRSSIDIDDGINYDIDFGWRKEFPDPDQELNISGRYSKSTDKEKEDIFEEIIDDEGGSMGGIPIKQRTFSDEDGESLRLQLDYVDPLSGKQKLEAGYKSEFSNEISDYKFENFEEALQAYLTDSNVSNEFEYIENIHSLYATYQNEYGNFGFKIGSRLELVETTANQKTTIESFENDYFSWFPSAHTHYDLSDNNKLIASYSRRIQRPRSRSLNPFPNLSDPRNIRVGNPFLRPEYIDSYEFGFDHTKKSTNLIATLYYRQINDVMQRFTTVDDEGIATSTYLNLDQGRNYGLELIASTRIKEDLRINASANFYRQELDGGDSDVNAAGESATGKFMAVYTFDKTLSAQLSANYRAKEVTAQGERKAMFSSDIAVKKTLYDRKLTLSLRLSDIFNTRRYEIYSEGETFRQNGIYRWESQVLNFSASYRFGKFEQKDRKRGSGDMDRGGDGGGDFDMDF